jgi:signal peptidase I
MKNKKIILLLILIVTFAAIIFQTFKSKKEAPISELSGERSRKTIYDFDPDLCPGKEIEFTSPDTYMRGLIGENEIVNVILNYYNCNSIERDDLVLYRYSEFDDPVIRKVVAIQGDEFHLEETPESDYGWQIYINKKKLKDIEDRDYTFGGAEKPPLALFEEQRKGVVGDGEVILLSSVRPGDKDSGYFGLVSVKDIVGKVALKK